MYKVHMIIMLTYHKLSSPYISSLIPSVSILSITSETKLCIDYYQYNSWYLKKSLPITIDYSLFFLLLLTYLYSTMQHLPSVHSN